LNKKGNILMAQKKYDDALEAYKKSVNLAIQADEQLLTAKILVNILEVAGQSCDYKQIKHELELEKVLKLVKALTDSHDKAFALISLGKLMLATFKPHKQPKSAQSYDCDFSRYNQDKKELRALYLYAYQALKVAHDVAFKIENNRAQAYGNFYLAQVYAEQPRYSQIAIQLTQEAIRYIESEPMIYSQQNGSKWITHADNFGPKGFEFYSSSPQDAAPEHCCEKCQKHENLPATCFGTCQKNMPPLFLQNYYPELLFHLKRQLGNFLNQAQAENQSVIDAYNQAAKYLQQVRQGYRCGSSKLGEEGEAFFVEVADFLLQSAKKAQHSGEKQKLLKMAIDTIESLRETELQNYFQDVCVTQKVKKTRHDKLPEKTAIFYPILFEEKGFLLLTFHDDDSNVKQVEQIRQVEVDIPVQQLKKEADDFWQQFGDEGAIKRAIKNDKKYLDSAKKLYKWLIEPITAELEARSIETLVIVPGGDLFHLPFAALYDANQKKYLFEKYALAILPAWKLTDMRVIPRRHISALLMGLKKSQAEDAKKFGELTSADEELTNIIEALEGSGDTISQITARLTRSYVWGELLKDEDFTINNVKTSLTSTPYSIVHFTTHGHFDSEADNTFLVAYDKLLKLNQLETFLNSPVFKEQPVELLTLSACESALGSEHGLAGVAIKTGARSALATLWKVNDKSTADLMDKFYEHFIKLKSSKALALQEAQRELLKSEITAHPYYWAPFVLIGNWM
jgi:CHAT domain-containing protein